MRVRTLAALVIAALAGAGMGIGYLAHGHLNAWYCLLSLFVSINIVICYWEACHFPAVRPNRKARRLLARSASVDRAFGSRRVPGDPSPLAPMCVTDAVGRHLGNPCPLRPFVR